MRAAMGGSPHQPNAPMPRSGFVLGLGAVNRGALETGWRRARTRNWVLHRRRSASSPDCLMLHDVRMSAIMREPKKKFNNCLGFERGFGSGKQGILLSCQNGAFLYCSRVK